MTRSRLSDRARAASGSSRAPRVGEVPRSSRNILTDQDGATMVEYALILAAVAIPLLAVFRVALNILVANYQMITFMIGWPFP